MRILLTADPELPVPPRQYGGIERIVAALAREMAARGHEVGLLAHADSTAPAACRYPWPGRRSQHPRDSVLNAAALARCVRAFGPDVLHSFSRVLYLLPLLCGRLPKVMSYQRRPGARQVRIAALLGGRHLSFTGCSRHIRDIGAAAGGRWEAIHNFVELERYTFRAETASDAPLVFLSRIERLKGAHTAIAIARRSGRRLLLAGNHGEQGEEGRYWNEVIRPSLGRDGIEYVGEVDDRQKDALLGSAAAMVVPVEWDEPFGIVFAESLACGTPVISRPRGALPEIVRDGKDGFLVDSVEEGCAAVDALTRLSRADCRARAETSFSAGVIASQYEALYRRALGEEA